MRCIWGLNNNALFPKMPFWQSKCVAFFHEAYEVLHETFVLDTEFSSGLWIEESVMKKKQSTSVLNATLHVTYNLIFHLWRLLRKAIENNWIHSKSSRTGIILHFHQQPSDENLIINAKWDGVKMRDWDRVPAEFPTAWLLGHHLGSLEMLLHPHEGEKGTELRLSTFLGECLCPKYEGE